MEISAAHKNGIRIVVVGDADTGKSSLIHTAVSRKFKTKVDPVLPPTLLPEFFPDKVPVTVIDTSAKQRQKTMKEMRRADAILLTYVAHRHETRERLSSYWLPQIRQLELVNVPIIVVGCKVDLKYAMRLSKLESLPLIMEPYPEIETCMECSARKHIQVREVFYYAIKAALYPTPPLFDRQSRTLRPHVVNALKRIFILSDHDKDGFLSDAELNEFEVKCFNTPLEPSQIVVLKRVVLGSLLQVINEHGLPSSTFISFHTDLIKKWREEMVWIVLRKFGYNNDIRLVDLLPSSFQRFPDQSVELTDDAVGFLKGVFSGLYDSNDGFLQPSYMELLFSTAPDCPWNEGPYKDAAPVSKFGVLTVDGFFSEWVLMTLLDPAKSMEYLKYLTYGGDASSALRLTRRRCIDREKRQSVRKVYQCFVFGPKKAGKSALLDAFLEGDFSDKYHANTEDRYAVNVVDGPLGSKKFLVLREIREDKVQMLLSDKESLAACDVAVFLYDSTNESSWKKTANLLVQVAGHGEDTEYEVPCLIVAAKADMDQHRLENHESTRVCQDMGIELPVPINVKSGDVNDIFRRILKSAEHPHLSIPVTEAGKSKRQ